MIAHNPRDAGIRKAAILVASLDRAAAERLLEQLGPQCAALVRQAATSVEQIDAHERQRVIDEFRRIEALVPDKCPAGIDLDGPVARQLAQAASEANRLSSAEQTPSSAAIAGSADAAPPPFSFLSEAAEEQLSALLGGERPQTIAVVFSQLPPERAGTVLGRLPPLLQVEVVRRLAELDSSDPETLREIEQTLLARLSRQFAIERKHTAGPETIAKILAACDTRLSAKILTNLAQHDRPLAERLVARPLCSENYPPRTTRAA